MELKDFQQTVLDTFSAYLSHLRTEREKTDKIIALSLEQPDLDIPIPDFAEKAWDMLRKNKKLPKARKNISFSPRKDGTGVPVPSVCFKIPTGGGKTLLATYAASHIMGQLVRRNTGFVLWIVPNEAIYSQTIKAFRNREHPYRQTLDKAAAGRVKILEKKDRLDRRDVDSHLCVMLLMLQSANRETKESLKFFRDRGNVQGFFPATDDLLAHVQVLATTPNLDVYGDKNNVGAIVKDSLGNALRLIRPVVVLDEGHKGYSKLAMNTLYDFNPCFVLELTATPVDRIRDEPPTYSNWLVDVRGTDLDGAGMVKLPINVIVRGGDDWRDCLRESVEHLNKLQAEAERLRADSNRYIRPICLIQVERTGKDQRDGGHIHANDAREYLLTLGVEQEQIAVKTAETNELNQPENMDLLRTTNQIRFIITKQALQEGWDCPFAYVLCSLAPVSSKGAMTQLVGRILRQPDTEKTAYPMLNECFVFCYHSSTSEVIKAIKNGLEQDGMSDLASEIRDKGNGGTDEPDKPRRLQRRQQFQVVKIFLPLVLWADKNDIRLLDYEADILYRIDWSEVSLAGIADKIPSNPQIPGTQYVQLGLASNPDAPNFLQTNESTEVPIEFAFDPTYVTRSLVDIVPNPWIAREFVESSISALKQRGFSEEMLAACGGLIISTLRVHLTEERDRLAEALFLKNADEGFIQFRLRTDIYNWAMPDYLWTEKPANSPLLQCGASISKKSLFEPAYKEDLNGYEQKVACYLDGERALQWWHRNVAKSQVGYGLQGWRKHKVYPDFIFALKHEGKKNRLLVLETKGDYLDNPETAYKKRLLDICTQAFCFENVTAAGELELVSEKGATVTCSLIFENNWQTELAGLIGKADR
jgi:type III restriction enzyme